jgi:hypothetical protein
MSRPPMQLQAIPVALAGREDRNRPDRHRQDRRVHTAAPASVVRPAAAGRRPGPAGWLVLSPTRELSGQIRDSFCIYGR